MPDHGPQKTSSGAHVGRFIGFGDKLAIDRQWKSRRTETFDVGDDEAAVAIPARLLESLR
jgi:hypothetical protein